MRKEGQANRQSPEEVQDLKTQMNELEARIQDSRATIAKLKKPVPSTINTEDRLSDLRLNELDSASLLSMLVEFVEEEDLGIVFAAKVSSVLGW